MKKAGKVSRHVVTGSDKVLPKDAKLVKQTSKEELIEVTLVVRRNQALPSLDELSEPNAPRVSREQLRDAHGVDASDIEKVEAFAHEYELSIVQVSHSQRTVRLSGPIANMQKAFGVALKNYKAGKTHFRGRKGTISIPSHLAGIVEGVFGLDNRQIARPHFVRYVKPKGAASAHASGARAFSPVEVGKLYNFPAKDGDGQCIAIIELGGGYRTADLKTYFQSIGVPLPTILAISVSGGTNAPTGDPDGPDGEVMLDIEVAGAIAPKAKIAVYFAPNTDAGFLNALKVAIHDTVRKPSVVSISWGSPEKFWTAQALKAFNDACHEAAALGITVCCSAGDHGAQDQEGETRANADFPASSPFALACGGTRLIASGSTIASESVWNNRDGWATGGGVSEVFAVPSYQSSVSVPKNLNPGGKKGRGVPDISGNADAQTGYKIRVDGVNTVSGGTSAVSPLWAALIALLNQSKGTSVGFLTPRLYQISSTAKAFHDITSGDNQAFPPGKGYSAGPGWDACTGLGSPNGRNLLSNL